MERIKHLLLAAGLLIGLACAVGAQGIVGPAGGVRYDDAYVIEDTTYRTTITRTGIDPVSLAGLSALLVGGGVLLRRRGA